MKKWGFFVLVLSTILSFCGAEELTGFAIMKKADERPQPVTSTIKLEMTLINAKGKARVRSILLHKKEYDSETKQVMSFLKPADVKGVGYLSVSYKAQKDDDRWLYIPAMKKVRRISGSGSGESFMGSEFTYDDMGGHKLSDYEYTLLDTEAVDGKHCWKINCKPLIKKQYSKCIMWIDQESLSQIKAEFYDSKDMLLKVLTISNLEKQDGFWVAKKMSMENVQTKHRTLITILQSEYNRPIPDTLFRASSLEAGAVR
ncbi:MAG: outer membrane lipoprotein-sorting protein [Treponema sp.]